MGFDGSRTGPRNRHGRGEGGRGVDGERGPGAEPARRGAPGDHPACPEGRRGSLAYATEAELAAAAATPKPMRLVFLLPAGTNQFLGMLGRVISTAQAPGGGV